MTSITTNSALTSASMSSLSSTITSEKQAVYYYTNKPTEFMRQGPSTSSMVVSDTLYGEAIVIVEEQEQKETDVKGWIKIRTILDEYEGWVSRDAVCKKVTPYIDENSLIAKIERVKAHVYAVPDIRYGPIFSLPYGVLLKVLDKKIEVDQRLVKIALLDGQEVFVQRGDFSLKQSKVTKEELVPLSKQFLGIPYTWGGRSSFGFDCSGFTQMLYREMGISIPRDTKDQVNWKGFESIALSAVQPGDLIFFGRTESVFCHVGLYVGNNQFIQAGNREHKPYVKISNLTDETWNGRGDYKFRTARRLISNS